MAQYTGKGGTLFFGDKPLGGVNEWQLDTSHEQVSISDSVKEWGKFASSITGQEFTISASFDSNSLALAAQLALERVVATVNLFIGMHQMEGYCNPEHTRAYFPSPVSENKYHLMHMDGDKPSLRREKVVSDLGEAQRWVLYGR